MRLRITIVLMLAIGGLTGIAVGSVLLVLAGASVRNTLELMQNRAQLMISAVERGVFDHVAPARNLMAEMKRQVEAAQLHLADRQRLVQLLTGALASAPQLGGIVIWRPDGNSVWITRDADGKVVLEREQGFGDPNLRNFLVENAVAGTVRWGAPFFRDGKTYVTISTPLYNRRSRLVGVVATGVSLVDL